jgi:hypothetical protein
MTLRNQNCITEKLNTRLNSGILPHHSIQNRVSSYLLAKNGNINPLAPELKASSDEQKTGI